jgi:hypothetical protein
MLTKSSSIRHSLAALVLALALLPSFEAAAVDHQASTVSFIRPGGDRLCTLFQLAGISQADPVVPGSAWFSINMDPASTNPTPLAKEMFASLLVAKVAGRTVRVSTNGGVACGQPTVSTLLVE